MIKSLTVEQLISKLESCSATARVCVLVYDEMEGCGVAGKVVEIKERETTWGEKIVILHDGYKYD